MTVRPAADKGWDLRAWTGACKGQGLDACVVRMDVDREAGAAFAERATVTVEVVNADPPDGFVKVGEKECRRRARSSASRGTR